MAAVRGLLGQSSHDSMVRAVAGALIQQGVTDVRADIVGYMPPPRIFRRASPTSGHVPDVTGGRYIIEVETGETIGSEHTRSQLELFALYAREHRLLLVVVVPAGWGSAMQSQLMIWGIVAQVWEV